MDVISFKKELFDNNYFQNIGNDGFVSDTTKRDWSDVEKIPDGSKEYREAVLRYQRLRPDKLVDDGLAGPFTLGVALQEQGYKCGHPDHMFRTAELSEWPEDCQRSITTKVTLDRLRQIEAFNINEMWNYAIGLWNNASGVLLKRPKNNSEKIRITAAPGQMRQGVLAYSYLPNNNCSETLEQRYNQSVNWTKHLFWTTVCHEVGHAIGLSHGGNGIMQPAHDPNVRALGSWDIAQVVERYGEPQIVDKPAIFDIEIQHITLTDKNGNVISNWDKT